MQFAQTFTENGEMECLLLGELKAKFQGEMGGKETAVGLEQKEQSTGLLRTGFAEERIEYGERGMLIREAFYEGSLAR